MRQNLTFTKRFVRNQLIAKRKREEPKNTKLKTLMNKQRRGRENDSFQL